MIPNDHPCPQQTPEISLADAVAAPPELGDVVDSIDDAASTLGRVVRNEAESLADDLRSLIRERPVVAVAVVGATAYLLGRLMR